MEKYSLCNSDGTKHFDHSGLDTVKGIRSIQLSVVFGCMYELFWEMYLRHQSIKDSREKTTSYFLRYLFKIFFFFSIPPVRFTIPFLTLPRHPVVCWCVWVTGLLFLWDTASKLHCWSMSWHNWHICSALPHQQLAYLRTSLRYNVRLVVSC